MNTIALSHIEYMVFSLAKQLFSYNEPIPDFHTRYPNILESCLATPFQSFGGKDLYPSFDEKCSVLFYLMIKNHPFQNGNKRIAMTTLMVTLYINNLWIEVDTQELYNFAVWVAGSPSDAKEEMLKYIERFLKTHEVLLKKTK